MPGLNSKAHQMPQMNKKGCPDCLPNLPFADDISRAPGVQKTLTPNTQSMQPHRSKATVSGKKKEG